MDKYSNIFINSFSGYWNYLLSQIFTPTWNSYFYWVISLSLIVWGIEIIYPWRKTQSKFRKDFWLDLFYLFFNFFLFYLIGYNAMSNIGTALFNDFLNVLSLDNIIVIHLNNLPIWIQYIIWFLVADFVQWNTHRLLHRIPFLWNFHKIHHSVEEMGFAAHFRFHWMETIIYNLIKFIPLTMIGCSITNFFIIHQISITIGHLNHANINLNYGPLKYVINNPKMHIWHHAKDLPLKRKNGVNFGISLSLWDYMFNTSYIPKDGKNILLGFENIEDYPTTFLKQIKRPFNKDE